MTKKNPVKWIDAAGATVAVGGCALAAWLGWLRPDSTTDDIRTLSQSIPALETQLASSRADLSGRTEALLRQISELSEQGTLPRTAQVEASFHQITALATSCRLDVARVTPLASQAYPGIRESRYLLELSGTTTDIGRFLSGIEHSQLWVDVGYLSVSAKPERHDDQGSANRVASITISIFSAPEADEKKVKRSG